MARKLGLLFVPLVLCSCLLAATRQQPPREVFDPDEVKTDPDFAVQGEYLSAAGAAKYGAQVIALGKGQFNVLLYKGGLPGDGWKKSDPKPSTLKGKRDGETTKLEGNEMQGQIAGSAMTLSLPDNVKLSLTRTERKSPTLGAKPPAEAVVLFDGTSGEKFEPSNLLSKWKTLDSGGTTKDKFGDYTLHLEFRSSWMPDARGQARSNSGVYIHNCYEIQVLDSFGLEGKNDECGGFYQKKAPDVNMCYPPMTWQTYDVGFTAPRYEGGKKTANARITVKHNGVAIHDDYELPGDTPGADKEGPAPRPIELQGHGNHVHYQNVWLVEKK